MLAFNFLDANLGSLKLYLKSNSFTLQMLFNYTTKQDFDGKVNLIKVAVIYRGGGLSPFVKITVYFLGAPP